MLLYAKRVSQCAILSISAKFVHYNKRCSKELHHTIFFKINHGNFPFAIQKIVGIFEWQKC